jgi:tRNA(fMet)-specific endonuclease VapC
MYLLDTNTVIYFFKGLGEVADNLLRVPPKDVAVSTIVLYELEVGIAKSTSPRKRQKQLHHLTSIINVFPFHYIDAKAAADIRVKLERKGQIIGPYDVLIAATAVSRKCTLVTHNVAEFRRVAGLDVVDWL